MAALTVALNLLKELLKFAGARAVAEVELIWNFKDELEEMEKTLAMLESLLHDAERRSIQDEAFSLWYAELRGACYDIQDMLDSYLLLFKQQLENGKPVKVWFHNMLAGFALARRMKNMREKLNNIAERRNRFNLKEDIILDLCKFSRERETNSLIEPVVLGREEDRSRIVNLILDNKDSDPLLVIPIQGMGGLGKTTMARLIFNDKTLRDSKHFELWAWAHVSTEFDLLNVLRRMLESLKGSDYSSKNLQLISQELQTVILDKRVLIVLDDVWNIDMEVWGKLKTSLNGCLKGSTIVVTTRIVRTALAISTYHPYDLQTLSEETCLQIFQNRAFKSTDEMDNHPKLVELGKEIVKKCGGVALIANTLGSILSSNRDESLWLYVKDSEMKELHDSNFLDLSILENKILSSLKLSYNLMPSHLKLCFAYCSIFPKGCKIDTEKLVQHWIFLNFIRSTEDTTLTLKGIAQVYLNNLVSLSFLQKCEVYAMPECRVGVVMHDLIPDLAQLVAKDHDIRVYTDKENTRTAKTSSYRYLSFLDMGSSSKFNELVRQHGKARSVYLKSNDITVNDKSFSQLTCLRVFEVEGQPAHLPKSIKKMKQLCYISAQWLEKLPKLTSLPNLQFLSLQRMGNGALQVYNTLPMTKIQNLSHLGLIGWTGLKELPDWLGDLKNLEYLDVSRCARLLSLPESVCNLHNLLHLKLTDCYRLKGLPECLGKLKSLQYLDLSGCNELETLPKSISKLLQLERLVIVSVNQVQDLPEILVHLTSLKHLITDNCSSPLSLSSVSKIKVLTKLETLKLKLDITIKEEEVEVAGEESMKQCCDIVALQNLNILEGDLTIRGLERVKDPEDAEKASLKEKHNLRYLELIWDGDEFGDKDVAAAVFQRLQI